MGVVADVCGPCDLSTCASVDHCTAGVILDECDCCQVCARTEGELCDNRKRGVLGMCGDNLACRFDRETRERTCVCTESKMVCGSDGQSYDTPCQLNEETVRRSPDPKLPRLSMDYWGPCKARPLIVSPPQDTYGPMGANLTLDCEAKGFLAPIISWQYDNVEGQTISLPSDDQMISVQMQAGPRSSHWTPPTVAPITVLPATIWAKYTPVPQLGCIVRNIRRAKLRLWVKT